jgi:DNA-binding NtrC family response regulator
MKPDEMRELVKEKSILVVDDDEQMRIALTEALSRIGYRITAASNGYEAIEIYGRDVFSLIITDVKMPGMNGIELLRVIKETDPECPVVVITAFGTIDNAVEAMKAGAYDYILKPFSIEKLQEIVERAISNQKDPDLSQGNKVIIASSRRSREVICEDVKMKALLDLARRIAMSKATVLIHGESGTGKELLARFIHDQSPRKTGPFVAINCAAIPEGLLEGELFGHEKGSFTGAIYRRAGKFEQANGGTILLDEISEIPLSLQAKLLRVLQEFEVDRIGGKYPVPVDVRVIATTNVDLSRRLKEGKFREDLYYRLNVMPLYIPPLRERKGDIIPLVHHFLSQIKQSTENTLPHLTEEAKRLLIEYEWPGNVRELENTIQRAILLCNGGPIRPIHLFPPIHPKGLPSTGLGAIGSSVREMEKELIIKTLNAVNGNRTQAASILGISVRTLRNKLKEYRSMGTI